MGESSPEEQCAARSFQTRPSLGSCVEQCHVKDEADCSVSALCTVRDGGCVESCEVMAGADCETAAHCVVRGSFCMDDCSRAGVDFEANTHFEHLVYVRIGIG